METLLPDKSWDVLCGNAIEVLRKLPDESVHCCITSPPYLGLRDYGMKGQIGFGMTMAEYVEKTVEVFRETRRVLRQDGTLWLNLGDGYANHGGHTKHGKTGLMKLKNSPLVEEQNRAPSRVPKGLKNKDMLGIPWRVVFGLQDDGWYLRSDVIWNRPNAMPSSATDRPTKSHEYVFLMAKSQKYFYDQEAIREPHTDKTKRLVKIGESHPHGRNKRSVWNIPTKPSPKSLGLHFAIMPEELVSPCLLAGTSSRGCCPSCGKPWIRTFIRGEPQTHQWGKQEKIHLSQGRHGKSSLMSTGMIWPKIPTGWKQWCKCDEQAPVPCVVLDPFCGSGTVGVVAIKNYRRFVGIDLNPIYCDMARKRIAAVNEPRLVLDEGVVG